MDGIEPAGHPDVVEAGGLVPALEAVARREGVDLGRVYNREILGPHTAEVDTDRGRISVELGARRAFYLTLGGTHRGFQWATGVTDDLTALVRAVAAWRGGTRIAEFVAAYPFMTAGRLAEAQESGDPVAAQWEHLRTSPYLADERPFVDAVHADGRFRRLYPNLSHGTLRLSTGGGVQGAREIHILPVDAGRYRVEDTGTEGSRRYVASLAEALDVAAEHLGL
ncbi:DUF6193 family natural product biosynthesis protein [Streptomyces sp. NPDC002888]|uniref:DUF6193 family natural product biosynthesis protein n=1 Tax=Streptomyces sp. NPDC002888 TaxID=3364668 RepID=UPI0036B842C8